MKPSRVLFGLMAVLAVFFLTPISKSVPVQSASLLALKWPIQISRHVGQLVKDLVMFKKNADTVRAHAQSEKKSVPDGFSTESLRLENDRLLKLLELQRGVPLGTEAVVYARVAARSPSAWNRVFLLDKGTSEGIRVNAPVLSEGALIGKVVEAAPSVSKTLLLTDPNSRVGAILQRTRHQGILYGTFSGDCRMKYLSIEADIKPGDWVESAGYGGHFPKGLLIGRVEKVWKEPGQIYQVAEVKLAADISRVEEAAVLV